MTKTIELPVHVEVKHPVQTTLEVIPPDPGVHRLLAVRPMRETDSFTYQNIFGDMLPLGPACSPGLKLDVVKGLLDDGTLTDVDLDMASEDGWATNIGFSQLSPLTIVFTPTEPCLLALVLVAASLEDPE